MTVSCAGSAGYPRLPKIARLIFTAIAVLCLVGALMAQVSSGTLVGTVFDPSGAGIPNAKVQAKNVNTGVEWQTTATADGQYRINGLIHGAYNLTASAAGFNSVTLQNVGVDANKVSTENLKLPVVQVNTNIEVTEAVVNIDTTTATIQNVFDQQLVRDLPSTSNAQGMGVANLALLSAGVSGNGGINVGEGPSVGGQRPYNNNFMIEGVDANLKAGTGSLIRFVPNDSVAEFTVLQNQYEAQYGHSSGGQFNTILRSGGNSFHGSVYEYFQNRNLNAIDQQVADQAIANHKKPTNLRMDDNRFGGTIGGPAIRNKLFFFGDYEYNPVGQSTTRASVNAPTADGYAALSSMSDLNQTNLGILKKYVPAATTANGTVTVEGVKIPVGTLQFKSPNYQNNQAIVTSTDYDISEKDKLSGRYIYNRLAQIDAQATLPQFYTFNIDTYQVASLAEHHTFSPSLGNEFRIGFNRINQPTNAGNFKYPGLDSFPNIVINDTLHLQIGPDKSAPQTVVQNTYQLLDNFTWTKGRHTIQFGFDGRRYIAPLTFTQNSRGDYEYGTGGDITGLEVFLRDLTPDSVATRTLGNPVYYGDQYATYEYAQDTFRMRPNLTFTAGLRYEYTTVPVGERTQILNANASVPGLLTFGVPKAGTHDFAPRFGIAYSPGSSGTTSIRAGFGIAHDVLSDNLGINSLPPQLSTTLTVTNNKFAPSAGTANFLTNGGILPNAGGVNPPTSAYIPNQEVPYAISWNAGIQHVFAKDYTLEVRYLGTRGVHLDIQQRINSQAAVTAGHSLPTYLTAPSQATLDSLQLTLPMLQAQSSVVPAFAANGFTNTISEHAPQGWSLYNGLAVQLNRRFSNDLQFQGAYTWSHLIDNSTASLNTTNLTPRRPQDFQNLSSEKADSALDRRHRLTISAYYEMPWFRKSNWFVKNLVGNWTIAPIYTYESPEYATVQSALDSNLNGDNAGDRTVINVNGVPGTSSTVTALKNSSGVTVAYLANNPTAQYIVAGSGAYANGGRNTLRLRPINNVDLSLLKNLNLTQRLRMQFGAQFYNLLNHPQFLPGYANRVDNPTVLSNTSTSRSLVTAGSSNFNNPEAVFGSNPRAIQLSFKLLF
ncbi:MAG: carboxypeptidase regulatory-like domain-containing protein [Acidobacteriota bacterium]|nr:carboxypeptidase regulatory-like domain-containing protein [Acidobacteriota bacterium]